MNRLEAIRIFCAAAQTQHFRQTAQLLGISPQAVTRAVSFLEQEFGELLFVRNTRSTAITPFGEQVYGEAKAALSQADALFQRFSLTERTVEAGLVRVDTPLMDDFGLLEGVLARLRDHPGIILDWRSGNQYSHTDREQIDVGVRMGVVQESDFIVKAIAPLRMVTVMAPGLRDRLGEPENMADLLARFPLAVLLNSNSGKAFEWDFASGSILPENPVFIAGYQQPMMQAVLHGRAVGQFAAWSVRRYIASGHLLEVLKDEAVTFEDWQLYVYRPKRHRQTARVRIVFDALAEVMESFFIQD